MKVFFYLAFAGFAISVATGLAALLNFDISSCMPSQGWLTLFIYIVCVAALVKVKNIFLHKYRNSHALVPLLDFLGVTFIFIIISLFLTDSCYQSTMDYFRMRNDIHWMRPCIYQGQYMLERNGRPECLLTEQEYHVLRILEIKIVSGIQASFYGLAAIVLYSSVKRAR
jgi:hypothetical protein